MAEHAEVLIPDFKKRKLQRACDICRRRKVRCDASSNPMNRCTNCINANLSCTYVESKVRHTPGRTAETRLDKMERMLNNALAEGDHNTDSRGKTALPLPFLTPGAAPEVDEDELSGSDDEAAVANQMYGMQRLTIDSTIQRFFGKSSSVVLVTTARDIKKKYAETHNYGDLPKEFWMKRPQFWTAQPWVRTKLQAVKDEYKFPQPQDFLWLLIDNYFIHVNTFLPLLHRPTFESQVADGLHLRDSEFGSVVLLVCALGSRHTDDPRVLPPGISDFASAGWAWFDQVQLLRNSSLVSASIYEVQTYCLAGHYMTGCSSPQACWNTAGIGLRLIQDVGAHRKKVYGSNPTVAGELWKRAFWCLVYLDRVSSITLGRSPALHDEDFDVDLPVDCDDEYWTPGEGEVPFKQPPGIPSQITFFNLSHKLNQITSLALRTIYSINRSKVLLGYVGPQWQQAIVAQLDSALNTWLDSIPDHLRWDPSKENGVFFDQSAVLYAHYYQTQILIHRPFIPKPDKPSPLSFPSLAICANAARSCSHVVDHQMRRGSRVVHLNSMPTFCAGIVLLVNIWGAKEARVRLNHTKEMADVYKCMEALSACETIYHVAGRFWDILRDLAEAGNFPEFHASPSEKNNKRAHGSDGPVDPLPEDTLRAPLNVRRPFASSDQVSPSLDSVGSSGTSIVNSTAPFPPALIANPSTQDFRGDLSPSPVVGYLSTPEMSDHFQVSNHSSPGSLSVIFDGDTIPVTTNDLGRLPLHYGAKLPTNSGFGDMANGFNARTPSTALGGTQPNSGLAQGGLDFGGAQTGGIPGPGLPRRQNLEYPFPWMPYTNAMESGEASNNYIPISTTATTTTQADAMSMYVDDDTDQAKRAADRLDSTISSLFGDGSSTSATALEQTAEFPPVPVLNTVEDLADLFHVIFQPTNPPVETHPSPAVQTQTQQAQEVQGRGDWSFSANAQAYLQGWSNAPQAFQWGDWSEYLSNAGSSGEFGTGLTDIYQPAPDPPA